MLESKHITFPLVFANKRGSLVGLRVGRPRRSRDRLCEQLAL